ncbi:lipoprotein [Paramagnetospirillum caucaseum]|uniref:Lipoprotein n=1 Tax=Paramagnetospirillum caucaseum TaxID=1244869 RepID=M2ZQX7_9PROT|nr:capsid cement protein [Paramagnetospirillum caucaseum]EME69722.1 lipoprotein [Paramagnetospirillum caucaseum]
MHPTFTSLYTRSVTASGAIASARCVKAGGAQATAIGEKILGIARYGVADGQAATIDVLGSALAEAGAALNLDDDLTTDAVGRVIPVTDAATQRPLGRALSAASAAGQKVEVLLLPR